MLSTNVMNRLSKNMSKTQQEEIAFNFIFQYKVVNSNQINELERTPRILIITLENENVNGVKLIKQGGH